MFKKNHRCKGRPDSTIIEWPKNIFKNKIVNRIRELFLGFMVWQIWKTRNLKNFENKKHWVEEIWAILESHLIETFMLTSCTYEDFKVDASEKQIL